MKKYESPIFAMERYELNAAIASTSREYELPENENGQDGGNLNWGN